MIGNVFKIPEEYLVPVPLCLRCSLLIPFSIKVEDIRIGKRAGEYPLLRIECMVLVEEFLQLRTIGADISCIRSDDSVPDLRIRLSGILYGFFIVAFVLIEYEVLLFEIGIRIDAEECPLALVDDGNRYVSDDYGSCQPRCAVSLSFEVEPLIESRNLLRSDLLGDDIDECFRVVELALDISRVPFHFSLDRIIDILMDDDRNELEIGAARGSCLLKEGNPEAIQEKDTENKNI